MKKWVASCLVLILPIYLFAQTEDWDVYLAQYEGKPGSIILNMGLKKTAPLKEYPFVLVTGVRFTGCNAEGMPTAREFDNLYKVSDSVQATIRQLTSNKLVGTFTHKCERRDYFYVSDTTGLREALLNRYAQFPSYLPYINMRKDSTWTAYLDFLYPNEESYEYMQNQKVVMQLEKGGDRLKQARQTDHWAYFPTEKDRNCFMAYAIKQGFKIESTGNDGSLVNSFKLQVSRIDKVDLQSISKLTLILRREAKKCNGQYDGWETFVVK